MSDLLGYFKNINDIFWGTGIFQWWFYLSILLIIVFDYKRTSGLFFGGFSMLLLIGTCNPIAYRVMQLITPEWQYYTRLYTILPVPYTIAYGSVLAIQRAGRAKGLLPAKNAAGPGVGKACRANRGRAIRLALAMAVCALVVVGGTDVYRQDWMKEARNLAKVPDAVIPLTQALHRDEGVTIAVPEALSSYIRQVDASFYMPYGREVNALGAELSKEHPDPEYAMTEAGKSGCDYIVVIDNPENRDNFNERGWRERDIIDGYLVFAVEKVERVRYRYNAARQLIETFNMNADGEIIPGAGGYTYVRYQYDNFGNRISEAYFDGNSEAFVVAGGYSEIRKTYTRVSRQVVSIQYARDGVPVALPQGYAEIRYAYNSGSRTLACESYYGEHGERVLIANGLYASKEYGYDDRGNVIEERYRGLDGALCDTVFGYSMVKRACDSSGRRIHERYYGPDESLKMLDAGYAGAMWRYDDAAREVTETYLDENDAPTVLSLGCGGVTRGWDEAGNIVTEKYLDIGGNETPVIYGYSCKRWEYDLRGNRIREGYYLAGKPYRVEHGYCSVAWTYDDRGRVIAEAYLDEKDRRTCREFGYAEVRKQYDNINRLIREAYYDENGAPIDTCWGYASVVREYDDGGAITKEDFYDKNGNIVNAG